MNVNGHFEFEAPLVKLLHRLSELRASRARASGIPAEPYASMDRVQLELIHARELSRKLLVVR